VSNAQKETAALEPADDTILGKIREAILPDDGQTASRAATRDAHVMLTVIPEEATVDQVVHILQVG
jgi:hypothetical protein